MAIAAQWNPNTIIGGMMIFRYNTVQCEYDLYESGLKPDGKGLSYIDYDASDLTPVPPNTVASIISIHSFIAFMRNIRDSTGMLRSRQCDIIDWDACAGSFLSHCAGVPSLY